MPHNLTEVSTFTANVSVPDTGDARTAASVETPFQALANRAKYLKNENDTRIADLLGLKTELAGFSIGVRNVSSSNGTDIVVAAFAQRFIGGASYPAQTYASVAPGYSSVSTWHYLYAYDNSGAIAYERSTTGPDASYTFKTGDTSRVFVCSYYADSSGNVRPFFKSGNKYTWRRSAIASYAINSTGATSYVDLNLATWMSPLSTMVRLECLCTDSGSGIAQFRTNGDTANVTKALQADVNPMDEFDIETDASQVIEFRVTGGTLPIAFVFAVGYYE